MTFVKELDQIMKQDFGHRGLLSSLPENPIGPVADSLSRARRVILLTGFPVRLPDGSCIGETDGPSGTVNLAAALTKLQISVLVVTDRASFELLNQSLFFRAPKAKLMMLPETDTEVFIKDCVKNFAPTHLITLERPGKAKDGHFHNMRGDTIDDMLTDSSVFFQATKAAGAVTISIGDGGNEMGMGAYEKEVVSHVPFGENICAEEAADYTLAAGVSNWWGWGLSALLSLLAGRSLLPSAEEETELLRRVVLAGGVDGCTRESAMTVDNLSLSTHLSVLQSVASLTEKNLIHPEMAPDAKNVFQTI